MYADLHVHTYYSDGLFSPKEIFKNANEKNVKAIAITDHDTIFHLNECEKYAKKYGIQLIKGIELSCYNFTEMKKIHVLGLGINENSPNVKKLGERVLNGRTTFHKKMVQLIAEDNYEISFTDALAKSATTSVFKSHLYMAIKEKYPNIGKDFYEKYFLRDDTTDVDLEMKYIDIKEGIEAIIRDGGIPILAHPNLYDTFPEVEEYIEYGLQGIEISHPLMEEADINKAKELAQKHHLVMSGGSDFHMLDRNNQNIIGDYGLTKEEFDKLIEQTTIPIFK